MYSNERSFAILALDFWLYGGVADAPRPLFERDGFGDVDDGSLENFAHRNLIEVEECEGEFLIDPDSKTLLKKRSEA